MNGPRFPASVIGSMPRSAFVRDLISADEVDAAAMDAAVTYIVRLQEAAGLDIITDGEWRRKSYIGVIAELAHGFELSSNPADGRPWTIVVDRLAAKEPGFVAAEIAYVKGITDRGIKATLPSPALLGERMWDPVRSAAAYPTRDAFVRDCIPILRREIELIRDAGADILQIDDPHLCLFVDPAVRAQYDDADAAADFAVATVNELVAGIDGIEIALHLCRRAGARARGEANHGGGFGSILKQLNTLLVDHLTMEFTVPDAGDLAVLAQLRDDFHVGLGCVSVTPGHVDLPETIVARVEQALQFLTPERITLNPDCGFSPGSGAVVSIDEVYTKLKHEAAAARILRERYG